MSTQTDIDVGLNWSSPLVIDQTNTYRKKAVRNEKQGKDVVQFMPVETVIDSELSGDGDKGPWIAWKFVDDNTTYSYTRDNENIESNGRLFYAPYNYIEWKDGEKGYRWYREDGYPEQTKVKVVLRATQKAGGGKQWFYHVVDLEVIEEADEISESDDDVIVKENIQQEENIEELVKVIIGDNQVSKKEVEEFGLKVKDNILIHTIEKELSTNQRITIGNGFNNEMLLFTTIINNFDKVIEQKIFTLEEIASLQEIIIKKCFLTNYGISPRTVVSQESFYKNVMD